MWEFIALGIRSRLQKHKIRGGRILREQLDVCEALSETELHTLRLRLTSVMWFAGWRVAKPSEMMALGVCITTWSRI